MEAQARLALYLGLNNRPNHFHRLLRLFGSASELFAAPKGQVEGLNLRALLRPGLMEEAEAEKLKAGRLGVKLVIFGQSDYPERLLEIPNPPPVLWILGDLRPGDRWAAALVGSRKASDRGLDSARRLAFELGAAGLTVISGLARGIDAAAHQGALDSGGRTIAVLASGVDWIYPAEHKSLYRRIAGRGAVVSEMPLGQRPSPPLFPRRNRVISGLSLAVVVVEAAEKSGALITAKLALEQNREVLAMPGQAGDPRNRGAHRLIKNGAALAENIEDVLMEIRPRLLEGLTPLDPAGLSGRPLLKPSETGLFEGQPPSENPNGAPSSKADAGGPEEEKELEKAIYGHLQEQPRLVDELARLCGRSPEELAEALLSMELTGLIERRPSGHYAQA